MVNEAQFDTHCPICGRDNGDPSKYRFSTSPMVNEYGERILLCTAGRREVKHLVVDGEKIPLNQADHYVHIECHGRCRLGSSCPHDLYGFG